jgi:hypothetical protein
VALVAGRGIKEEIVGMILTEAGEVRLTMRGNSWAFITTMVLMLVTPCLAGGQEGEAGVSEQFWLDYNPRWTDESGREIFGDVGLRTLLGSDDWLRLVVRPGVRAPVGPFRLSGGLGTVYRINREGADKLELRPFQGIAATWPKGHRLRLQHYLRLEERFVWETSDWKDDISLRARYRLQTDYSFSGFRSGSDWRVLFHIEGFYTLAGKEGETDEKLRVGFGVGRNLGSKLRLRADFSWEKLGLDPRAPSDAIIIRLRVFHGLLRRLLTHDG